MPKTAEQIRRLGLLALREKLGQAGMVRFLQQFESGKGDYTKERREMVDRLTLDDIRREVRASKPKSRTKKKKG